MQLIVIAVFFILISGFTLARSPDMKRPWHDPVAARYANNSKVTFQNYEVTGVHGKLISGTMVFSSTRGELQRKEVVHDCESHPLPVSGKLYKGSVAPALQKNILYKGQGEVKNGLFSFSFVVPHDIAYQYGFDRISCYIPDSGSDAAGPGLILLQGALIKISMRDEEGPFIERYMNDAKFVSGGCRNTLT